MSITLSEIKDPKLRQRLLAALEGATPVRPPPAQTDATAPRKTPKKAISTGSYSKPIVREFFEASGLPDPVFEWRFHPARKWRFDICWPKYKVALEVQGGIFAQGRHTRGAALLKEWEKLNTAATLGWRILYCQPKDLLTRDMATMIFSALQWKLEEIKP